MKNFVIGLFVLGLTNQAIAQTVQEEQFKTIELSEVNIMALNSTYINKVIDKNAAQPVQQLERKAAAFNILVSDIYSKEFDSYEVKFENEKGRITATYDIDGEIMRSYEKFKDIKLPRSVAETVVQKFPGWAIVNTTYLVNYRLNRDLSREYKIFLEKGNEKMVVKTDEVGNFLK